MDSRCTWTASGGALVCILGALSALAPLSVPRLRELGALNPMLKSSFCDARWSHLDGIRLPAIATDNGRIRAGRLRRPSEWRTTRNWPYEFAKR